MMISYSDNREDVVLDRVFPRGLKGFYVSVGAHDPVQNSSTKHFYDLGWHGINIEPVKQVFDRLAEARDRDINLNIGLGDTEGELTFYESPSQQGISALSTFSAESAAKHRALGIVLNERAVPVSTLAKVCEEHVSQTIDFMTIDVEGFEAHVIRGADWKLHRPRVLVVEATLPNSPIPSHEDWEPILLDAGYLFASFDGLNRFYVRKEDEDLLPGLSVGANVFDEYMTYDSYKQAEDFRNTLEAYQAKVTVAQAVSASLVAEMGSLPGELQSLRMEYERLERTLANVRADCENLLNGPVAEAQATQEQLYGLLDQANRELEATRAMLGGVGPSGVAVARRLAGLASRYPLPAKVAKKGLRTAASLLRR